MAKFSSVKRLILEDFPQKYNDLTSPLFTLINDFFQQVTSVLNKGLTFNDNFQAYDTEFIVTTPLTVLSIQNSTNLSIRGSLVLRVDNLTNPTVLLTNAPFIEFQTSGNQIKIRNITGLATNTKYRIRAVFFA